VASPYLHFNHPPQWLASRHPLWINTLPSDVNEMWSDFGESAKVVIWSVIGGGVCCCFCTRQVFLQQICTSVVWYSVTNVDLGRYTQSHIWWMTLYTVLFGCGLQRLNSILTKAQLTGWNKQWRKHSWNRWKTCKDVYGIMLSLVWGPECRQSFSLSHWNSYQRTSLLMPAVWCRSQM